ncbi:MAG: hypothetical protein RL141_750 [Candidatus Parcubacteria bacterium]|jgi:penicillin-binding protein 2
MIMSETPSSLNPFRLQSRRGGLTVEEGNTGAIRHEVLFEDQVTRLRDRAVFVGSGLPAARMRIALICGVLVLGLLVARAGWMQSVRGEAYTLRADDNRFRHEVLPARRGIIRDRDGAVLAENVPTFHVSMRWSDLPSSDDARAQVVALVARMIGTTSEELLTLLQTPDAPVDEWITVARDVSYDRAVALQVHLPELPGVSLAVAAKRHYPESRETPSLSHVLGYVGGVSPQEYAERRAQGYRRTDEIGKIGVEVAYEDQIRGEPGERRSEVDAFGRPRAIVGDRAPVDGEEVRLTIDLALQQAAEKALINGMARASRVIAPGATSTRAVTRGSALLMDAQDGSMLALVSLPAFDNNLFAGSVSSTAYRALVENEDHPLFPRAWAGQFPSGSTIKPLIATAALAEGVVTPNTTVFSVGGINVGPWFFPDWKAGGHGPTNVRYALAWSVNTFFYYVGGGYGEFIGLGVDRLTAWMERFGLGSRTGFALPTEATGHVPSQAWKEETKGERWYIGDTYNLSIGQGDLLVTPLQMARMTAAIANGGTLVEPHVVSLPSTGHQLEVDPAVLATVRQGMRETVTYGSGRALSILPMPVAGKTGTAQWRSDRPNHAWFIGYAPAENPEVVVVVLLEEGQEGSSYAVPVAGDILRAWWEEKQSP